MKKNYTLEAHLHKLSKKDETAQHLMSIYDLQKQKMERSLLSVVTTFPTYSSHDTAHSSRIVMAMERILGKQIIKQLSSTDTFLLLMCAYMHDVGMLYTDKEVRTIWGTQGFKDFLNSCKDRSSEIKHAVSIVTEPFPADRGSEWPLEVRQSVTILLMEYYRPQHGGRIENLTDPTQNRIASLLRIEDSYLPERIIQLINTICKLHNDDFSTLLSLIPFEDSFGRDSFHPRMVAYMLRLCDLCDTDNDRFNRIGIYTFGNLTDNNLPHYFKHQSVETLHISPRQISVTANIQFDRIKHLCMSEWMSDVKDDQIREERINRVYRQTVKEHISWKHWMEQEIQNGRLNHNQIFPSYWAFSLPEVDYTIKIDGKESASTSNNLRFLFTQERAFELIESISIYQNESMIFLRELIQNAIDATKLQLWRYIVENDAELATKSHLAPFDVEERFPGIFNRFPINTEISYNPKTRCAHFSIVDKGIGISIEELKSNILVTGTSWHHRERYKSELEQMPDWLRPTGAFGIGMHSVFYVTDEMRIMTKSNMEDLPNEIVLCSGKKDGFAFCRKIDQSVPRGSTFSFDFDVSEDFFDEMSDSSCPSFLRNDEETVITAAKETIERWMMTPLFPIYFNKEQIISSLSDQYDFMRLCDPTIRNHLQDQKNAIFDAENYDFAFSNDYQGIIIWDRKNECIMHFSIGDGTGCSVSVYVKGIYVTCDDPRDGELSSFVRSSILNIDLLDVLASDTKSIMDASRTSIKKQFLATINSIILKAEEQCISLYLQLLDTMIKCRECVKLQQAICEAACRYRQESTPDDFIWDDSKQLFDDFFQDGYMTDAVRNRIILQFCFKIIDQVIYAQSKQFISEDGEHTITNIIDSIGFRGLSILDQALKSYSEITESDEWEISQYVRKYLATIHYLIDYYVNATLETVEQRTDESKILRILFSETALSFMDYIVQTTHCTYLDPTENYGVRDEVPSSDSLLPIANKISSDGECTEFSDNAYQQLFLLNSLWYSLILRLATTKYCKSELYKRLWTSVWSDQLFGELYVDGKTQIKHFFDFDSVSIELNNPSHPFLYYYEYPIQAIRLNDTSITISYSISYEIRTVEMDSNARKWMYRYFWEIIAKCDDSEYYLPLIAPSCFELLAVFPNSDDQLSFSDPTRAENIISGKFLQIPTWDYTCNINSFMKDYSTRESKQDCLTAITSSPQFEGVTKYICECRSHPFATGTRENDGIKAQYTEFLSELLDAYYDYNDSIEEDFVLED